MGMQSKKNGQDKRVLWMGGKRREEGDIWETGRGIKFLLICFLLSQARGKGCPENTFPRLEWQPPPAPSSSSSRWGPDPATVRGLGNHVRYRAHAGSRRQCSSRARQLLGEPVHGPIEGTFYSPTCKISFPVPFLIRSRFHGPELGDSQRAGT